MDKDIVYRVEDGMDREKILCTTYQMRNFYMQFRDGFFTNLDVMNYIQHLAAAHMAKKGMNVLDVCCGRSLMLPLLRYYAKDIASYTGVDISKANIKEAMRGATAKNLEPKDLTSYYPFRVANMLCALPFKDKRYAPAVLLGIAIANATSPFGPVDVLFGLLAEGTAYALVVWGPWKRLGILWKAVILSLSVALFIGVELSMMVGAPFWLTSAGLFVGTFLAVELGNLMISKTALAKVV